MLVDPANIATAKQIDEPEFEVLLYEFKADLNAYLAGAGPDAPVRSLADVIAFNEAHRDRRCRTSGRRLCDGAGEGPLTDQGYLRALADAGGWRGTRGSTRRSTGTASTPSWRPPAVRRG